MAGVNEQAVLELKNKFKVPFVELVGFDKINSMQRYCIENF